MALDGQIIPPAGPFSIELEQAVLGAVLLDNQTFHRLRTFDADAFYDPVHMQIFTAIKREIDAGRIATPLTIAPLFRDHPEINPGVTVAVYLGRLVASATTTENAPSYMATVADLSRRRKALEIAASLGDAVTMPSGSLTKAVSAAMEDLGTVLSSARPRKTRSSFRSAASDMIDDALNPDNGERLPTGFASLQKVTGGWRRGNLVLLAGRPSMGKTTVGVSLATSAAKKGVGVALFSLEMARKEIAARMCSDLVWSPESRVEYTDALSGKLSDQAAYRFAQIAAKSTLPVEIDDQGGLTVAEIAARSKQIAAEMARNDVPLGIVMIDHLGHIKASGRYAGNKVQEVGEISGALKQLAKDLNVCVIALNQLNRGTEGRENKRPTLPDLRNSGDLEQDADTVIFTYRESYYLERMRHDPGSQKELERQTMLEAVRNSLDLIFAKNRNGPTDVVTMFADIGCNAIRDAAP